MFLRGQKSKKKKNPKMTDFCHSFLLRGKCKGGRTSDGGMPPHAPLDAVTGTS